MSDYGFFNDNPVAEHDDSIEREVERLQAELAVVRAERDAAQETAAVFNWLAAQMHKGTLSVMAWPNEVTLHVWEGSTIRKFTGATLAEAVRAAQAGGPQ